MKTGDVWSNPARVEPSQPLMLAIDPGDVHVGLAQFRRDKKGRWGCVWAGEMTPPEFLDWLAKGLRVRAWDQIVLESWHLFPSAAPVYVGSDMPTSRLIGAIHAMVAYVTPESWLNPPPPIEMQDPQIKVPTRSMLRRRKLHSMAKHLGVSGDHASDAELHGFHYLIRNRLPIRDRDTTRQGLPLSHELW